MFQYQSPDTAIFHCAKDMLTVRPTYCPDPCVVGLLGLLTIHAFHCVLP